MAMHHMEYVSRLLGLQEKRCEIEETAGGYIYIYVLKICEDCGTFRSMVQVGF